MTPRPPGRTWMRRLLEGVHRNRARTVSVTGLPAALATLGGLVMVIGPIGTAWAVGPAALLYFAMPAMLSRVGAPGRPDALPCRPSTAIARHFAAPWRSRRARPGSTCATARRERLSTCSSNSTGASSTIGRPARRRRGGRPGRPYADGRGTRHCGSPRGRTSRRTKRSWPTSSRQSGAGRHRPVSCERTGPCRSSPPQTVTPGGRC